LWRLAKDHLHQALSYRNIPDDVRDERVDPSLWTAAYWNISAGSRNIN
jgi:hypothetical protein